MMGVWFLSISVAQYVAGVVAQFASVETVGGQVTNSRSASTLIPRPSRPSPGSRSAPAWCCSSCPGRFRSGCMVSNKGWAALRSRDRASARLRGASKPKPKPAPAVHVNEDPYPSTYVRYPGRPDRHPPRHGVRRRRQAVRRRHRRLRRRRDPGGRRARAGESRRRARDRRHRQVGHARRSSTSTATSAIIPRPASMSLSDGNEATSPVRPEVWAEHSVWPQDPGFSAAR